MTDSELTRFLAALSPANLTRVRAQSPERQRELADAWEAELTEDTDLDALDEISPVAAEEEAAERVVAQYLRD